jgi:hypothetical protein
MSVKRLLIVSVAALGLSLSGYAASAGSVAQSGAASIDQSTVVNSKSTFTLVRGHGGGRGGMRGGGRGGMRAFRSGGFRGREFGGRGFRGRHFRGRGFRGGFGWGPGWDDCIWPYRWGPWCY